jgi:kynureninase
VALPPREDGATHHRHEGRDRRQLGRRVPGDHPQSQRVSRPLGHTKPPVGPLRPEALFASPNALAPHYSRFRVDQRLLLTGHSHQAWPDVGRDAQLAAWDDAAANADEKWAAAFAKADRVRRGFARLLDDVVENIALGPSTHDLLVRWLSALALRARPRIVTTDGEFHSARRQLDRLAEEGVAVVKVAALPAATLAERIAAQLDDRTAAVVVSAVLYQNAHIVPGLETLLATCRRHGAELLIDAYHGVNVVPFTIRGLEAAFVVGGGYKYCQLGEGNCFLRLPADCAMRPVVTGWFAEFEHLEESATGRVGYAAGSQRFAGSTYDPTSHYRAAAVFDFFEAHGLTPRFLRTVSQHQVELLARRFDALDLDPTIVVRERDVPLERIGGFLALRSTRAPELGRRLRSLGVWVDARGNYLRLGPAPYLSDRQIETAMEALQRVSAE